jgi:hypothetical protein
MSKKPVIVYGFLGKSKQRFLTNNFPCVNTYNDINDDVVYGIICTLDCETGKILTSENEVLELKQFYKSVLNNVIKGLGYHLVLDNN